MRERLCDIAMKTTVPALKRANRGETMTKYGRMPALHSAAEVRAGLADMADPERAMGLKRFFKVDKGQYGEGDVFWGIRSPDVRAVVKAAAHLAPDQAEILLEDAVHEVRLCALLILVEQFRKADESWRGVLAELYLRRTDRINSWDLVDLSACLPGMWWKDKERAPLHTLGASANMWEQRIAVVACHTYIREGDFTDVFALCRNLLGHPHDLMHKAMGWMLREVGKRDKAALEALLEECGGAMPRTMLRYAIERFPEDQRRRLLLSTRRPRPQSI